MAPPSQISVRRFLPYRTTLKPNLNWTPQRKAANLLVFVTYSIFMNSFLFLTVNILGCFHLFDRDTSKSPCYWSRVCLHNMAILSKEATTVRRVLEPFFHNFDAENYWSSEKGLAYSVLMYLQSLLEESGFIWDSSALSFLNQTDTCQIIFLRL